MPSVAAVNLLEKSMADSDGARCSPRLAAGKF